MYAVSRTLKILEEKTFQDVFFFFFNKKQQQIGYHLAIRFEKDTREQLDITLQIFQVAVLQGVTNVYV